MGIVSSREIAKAIRVDRLGFIGAFIGWAILKVTRISVLNKIYNKHKHKKGISFLNGLLNELQVKYQISETDLKRIPKNGAFIAISNHPLGVIDGVLLLKLLLEQRADSKVVTNFLLELVKPAKSYMLPVNPFENHKDIKSSVAGLKKTLLHIRAGKPLGIFPAGEVSTIKKGKLVLDKEWEKGAIKLIKKAKVPVIPIYFHAKNSKSFYFLSKISSLLRTAKLPSELLTQKKRTIKIRIGKPITLKDQEHYTSDDDFYKFLRKKTYMLSNSIDKKTKKIIVKEKLKVKKKPKPITAQKTIASFSKEIELLRNQGNRLLTSKQFEVFLAKSEVIPNLLHEIGRQRELTFRAVGEGTNNATDLDGFDNYYHHLLLWDKQEKKLAGAYRMGLGEGLFKKNGIKGFYVRTLFKIDKELHSMMQQTIELGRAYIIKEYQQKPMPLFLLWKGVIHVTLRYPKYKYLMGGVSISNQFSDFSKSLMIEFMKSHYYDPYIAQYIRPKKEYKVKLKDVDKDFVFDATKADMKKFDKFIEEIEPNALRIPVLIKKYVKQNARLVAFNVDPKFNNAIDGLMYIKIADLPENTVKPVLEEFQVALEREVYENETGK